MPAPSPEVLPSVMVRFCTVNVTPEFTTKICTVVPPLIVIRPPPSIVVLALMVLVLATRIVAGALPQSNVTVPSKLPPPGRQAFRTVSLQVPFPEPTTHARADEYGATHRRSGIARSRTSRTLLIVAFIPPPHLAQPTSRPALGGAALTRLALRCQVQ